VNRTAVMTQFRMSVSEASPDMNRHIGFPLDKSASRWTTWSTTRARGPMREVPALTQFSPSLMLGVGSLTSSQSPMASLIRTIAGLRVRPAEQDQVRSGVGRSCRRPLATALQVKELGGARLMQTVEMVDPGLLLADTVLTKKGRTDNATRIVDGLGVKL
jgi:hypothetical protein